MAENPESAVLRAIAELEAEPEPDEIHELVRWRLETGSLREGYAPRLRRGEYVIAAAVDREIAQLCQDYITQSLTGIPPMRLTGPVCLRRISPVTKQPYPREADTRALRPAWDSRMRPYSEIVADILGDANLRWPDAFPPIPDGAPYRYFEHFQLEPGDRVGWDNGDGVIHTGIVEDHRPTGRPGEWTITIGDPPALHRPGILGLIRDAVAALRGWLR